MAHLHAHATPPRPLAHERPRCYSLAAAPARAQALMSLGEKLTKEDIDEILLQAEVRLPQLCSSPLTLTQGLWPANPYIMRPIMIFRQNYHSGRRIRADQYRGLLLHDGHRRGDAVNR